MDFQAGSALEEPPQQGAFSVSLELDDLKPRLLGHLEIHMGHNSEVTSLGFLL